MPRITYDAQSFTIDSRRVWLVAGSIHYPRTPRQLWRSRIRAAKQAGLNCIETYVFWNVHEPQPGVFRFDGDADLRHFIELIAEEGMYAIVRPGPFVCAEWDFGGLPAWLLELGDEKEGPIRLREADPRFLQFTARYLAAVMNEIKDLQITSPEGGPIVMVQNENEWGCQNDEEADAYMGSITRFLRENGCTVPLNNCNHLWQPVAGTIDTWNGWNNLAQNCRQLRVARPDAPRIVTELWPGWFDAWNAEHRASKSAHELLRTLAEVSATGAQYNLYMFHGGTNFGFYGGRTVNAPDAFMITSYDYDAPLREAGGRGAKYLATKRISVFLSRFGQVMAHLRPQQQPTVASPRGDDVSVLHQSGQLGDVVFLTRKAAGRDHTTELMLPDGRNLPVHFGKDAAAWLLLNADLDGVATLDVTNLRPWALLDKRLLVLFGPAGTEALVSIDGAVLSETVPTTAKPLTINHRGLTVVILSDKQVDHAYIHDNGSLYVGVDGFDDADEPIRGNAASCTIIAPDGTTTTKRLAKPEAVTPPRLRSWKVARCDEYADGTAARYAGIDGPRSLEACGVDYGYGWYRVTVKRKSAGKVKLFIPDSADRLHLFREGKAELLLGVGAAADHKPVDVSLPKGESTLVFLADNLGRFNYGPQLGERKGIFGHLMHAKPIKIGKVTTTTANTADPFALRSFVIHARKGDLPPRPRYSFTFTHRRATAVVMQITDRRTQSVVLLNDEPIALDGGGRLLQRITLTPEQLKRGNNTVTFSPYEDPPADFSPAKYVELFEVEPISSDAAWAYARWRMPDEGDFGEMPARHAGGSPCWFRTTFGPVDTSRPMFVELAGVSKGQLYINGRNAGRYWVATSTGKQVPPQSRYYLPEPWLNEDGDNELVLFDEHGRAPKSCKLVYDEMGPFRDVP